MNPSPGFCATCKAPLDPDDDSEECAFCNPQQPLEKNLFVVDILPALKDGVFRAKS